MRNAKLSLFLIIALIAATLISCGRSSTDTPEESSLSAEEIEAGKHVAYTKDRLRDFLIYSIENKDETSEYKFRNSSNVSTEEVDADMKSMLDDYRIGLFENNLKYGISVSPFKVEVNVEHDYSDRLEKMNDFMPGGKSYTEYSEDGLLNWINEAVSGQAPVEMFFATQAADAATDILSATEKGLADSEYAQYYLESYIVDAIRFENGGLIALNLTEREEKPREIIEFGDMEPLEFVEYMIKENVTWEDETVFHCSNETDADDLSYLSEIAMINDPYDVTCRPDLRTSEEYNGKNAKIIALSFAHADGTDERNTIREEMQKAIDFAVEEVAPVIEEFSDIDKYRYIADYVCLRARYDDTLALATRADALAAYQWYQQTAYGALVDGYTVCSGYVAAYKAICDKVGLDSWVIHGTAYEGEEAIPHAWIAVPMDGAVYYIDPTYMDTSGSDRYFMFDSLELDGRTIDEGWIIPFAA